MTTKRELIDNPNSCLNKAHDDEPVFLLRAQDLFAPALVRAWATLAYQLAPNSEAKVADAEKIANAMLAWPNHFYPD